MRYEKAAAPAKYSGFTLIELLVVIAIIAVLAGLLFPVTSSLKRKRMVAVAQAELNQLQTAIEAYKSKLGHYPPDNPNNFLINQLYFELQGTVLTGGVYQTLDGSSQISVANLSVLFGPGVNGFVNSSSKAGGNDDAAGPKSFIKDMRSTQLGKMVVGGVTSDAILVSSVGWSEQATQPIAMPPAAENGLNPWRYISSSPTNNPSSYDLWVDIPFGKKLIRISNWSKQPQVF